MGAASAFDHRMHQAALQLQPVIRLHLQIGDRMLAEKFRCDLLPGRLAR